MEKKSKNYHQIQMIKKINVFSASTCSNVPICGRIIREEHLPTPHLCGSNSEHTSRGNLLLLGSVHLGQGQDTERTKILNT
ncbi:hypothetical protein GDO81_023145 [Engystomops pustulosus]|uniref:Uncharacterized protein n=1 Tax=Engystomops pustulosus TaxID=76066 RepID=A0AAV6YL87_ENGPU|nr:hypothetical protein GDO81_023145 [Engystomops pustulosus]